jgi:glyoxylase-like metal-dependent hydrolase (beta-lactamase superfamily II)
VEPIAIREGLWRWTAPHPDWQPGAAQGSSADWPREVGCVLYASGTEAVFIDPLVPEDDAPRFWRWADERCAGRQVVVLTTIDFHHRSREEILARYGPDGSPAPHNPPAGVEPIALAGAGETLYWLAEHRALLAGDRIIGGNGGGLRMCPQSWLDSSPSRITVAELRELLRALLALPIEMVLVSHGKPVLTDGLAALARALDGAGEKD